MCDGSLDRSSEQIKVFEFGMTEEEAVTRYRIEDRNREYIEGQRELMWQYDGWHMELNFRDDALWRMTVRVDGTPITPSG